MFQSSEWRVSFWTRVPWLSKEENEMGNERRPQARQSSTKRVCGVKFFPGTHPSYWAALEGTFLRLKLDQFTATFWRVCFAESRQNLPGTKTNKQGGKREEKEIIPCFSDAFNLNQFDSLVWCFIKRILIHRLYWTYLLKYSTSRSISSISVGSTSLGRNTSSKEQKYRLD